MSRARSSSGIVALALALVVGLAGCDGCKGGGTAGGGTDQAALLAQGDPASFKLIPAETPYVFASFQPVPKEVVGAFFAKFAPVFNQSLALLQPELDKQLQQGTAGGTAAPADAGIKAAQAVLQELQGNMSEQGLARLGLSTQPLFAVYGIGLLPAFRLELGDVAAFKATLERVQAKAGAPLPKAKLGDQEYWTVNVDQVSLAFAIAGKELIGAVAPTAALPQVLPILFGQQKPTPSLADSGALRKVLTDYGFKPYGLGYVDLRTVAAILLGEAKGLNATLLAAMNLGLPPMTPECKTEIAGLVEGAPRLVVGYDELTAVAMSASAVLEARPELVKEIAALRSPVPGLGGKPVGSPLVGLGLGLDVQKTLELLKAKALAIQAAPYKCDKLAELNNAAQELATTLASPQIPPFLTTLKGFDIVVQSADFEPGAGPANIQAVGVLASENPMVLVAMAQGFVPDLAKLKIAPDGTPVALPPIAAVPALKDAFVAVKGNLLGVSLGQGMAAELSKLLEQKPEGNPPLLAVTYNTPAMMEKLSKVSAGMNAGMPPEAKAEMDRSMAMNAAMSKVLGLTSYTLEVGERGFVARQRIELK